MNGKLHGSLTHLSVLEIIDTCIYGEAEELP
jgi:hypothetical protein